MRAPHCVPRKMNLAAPFAEIGAEQALGEVISGHPRRAIKSTARARSRHGVAQNRKKAILRSRGIDHRNNLALRCGIDRRRRRALFMVNSRNIPRR
jgi:hypothetical protein